MRHNGSFIGRDVKQLMQILPVCLRSTFHNDIVAGGLLDLTIKYFELVGSLSSLLYMRSVKSYFEYYLDMLTKINMELNDACLKLDNYCIRTNVTPPLVSAAPLDPPVR